MTKNPSCSVILATLSPWAEIRPLIEDLLRQADGAGGEVVVADGIGQARPEGLAFPNSLRWISAPGLGVFALRLAALHAARGGIVIVTEDHCYVKPDWCKTIIELHGRHPDADVIKGRVDNGSQAHMIDRAAFAMLQCRNTPPIDPREAARAFGINGVAFKRRALDAVWRIFPDRSPELLSPDEIRRANLTLLVDSALQVTHVQSETWWGHGKLHFHNARAIVGGRRRRASERDWLRVLAAPLLVPYRTWKVIRRSVQRHGNGAIAVVPAVAWLYTCKAAGECAGLVVGSGHSARKLH